MRHLFFLTLGAAVFGCSQAVYSQQSNSVSAAPALVPTNRKWWRFRLTLLTNVAVLNWSPASIDEQQIIKQTYSMEEILWQVTAIKNPFMN